MFYDMISLILAIFAFTTTVGLPYALQASFNQENYNAIEQRKAW